MDCSEKISVVVPVYKVEKYLEKCVESIKNQTYKNLEIILVDDGSPDGCGKLCDELAESDARIKVIHKENGGLSDARNAGIEIATGEYISFVDSDDYLSNDYCETLYTLIKDTNADIASVGLNMVRDDGTIINIGQGNSKQIMIYENEDIMRELLNWKTFRNYAWNKLYKKSFLGDLRFQKGINYEDIIFTYELMKKAQKVTYQNKPCYFYLRHSASISASCSEKNLNDFLDVVLYRFRDVEKNFPKLYLYNYYSLLDSLSSISIKYVIANQKFDTIDEKISVAFNELKSFLAMYEERFLPLLNDFQKVCIYAINYNIDLFYSFLKERQSLKVKGKID